MVGRRLPDGFHYFDSEPGDYWKQLLGTKEDPGTKFLWTIKDPLGDLGTITKHTVVEHEDGTITVDPSILNMTTVDGKPVEKYHGYLIKGVWNP